MVNSTQLHITVTEVLVNICENEAALPSVHWPRICHSRKGAIPKYTKPGRPKTSAYLVLSQALLENIRSCTVEAPGALKTAG